MAKVTSSAYTPRVLPVLPTPREGNRGNRGNTGALYARVVTLRTATEAVITSGAVKVSRLYGHFTRAAGGSRRDHMTATASTTTTAPGGVLHVPVVIGGKRIVDRRNP